ncbi:hypothetical protein CMV_010466 [Castanea mollissima]|uniref:Secreted protein n=1 Tax=Castanea mollissima TaxID=60419 RepID=A0A8J4W0Q1_9ROSI|nr:hypothetical protein CMV_010466 [Castanea mollissima]
MMEAARTLLCIIGKSLLRAVLGHANWKEPSILNERVMILWPHWTRLRFVLICSDYRITLATPRFFNTVKRPEQRRRSDLTS